MGSTFHTYAATGPEGEKSEAKRLLCLDGFQEEANSRTYSKLSWRILPLLFFMVGYNLPTDCPTWTSRPANHHLLTAPRRSFCAT